MKNSIKIIERKQFDLNELPGLGLIRITEHGEENVYFEYTEKGSVYNGYCKCL